VLCDCFGVTPKGVLFICTSCGQSRHGVYYVVLNHKQAVKMGILWCASCYEGAKGRKSMKGHIGEHLLALGGKPCMPLKKPSASNSSGGSSAATISTGTMLAAFPTLLEFLTHSKWEDGSPRQRGTLLLFVDGSAWKGCLKDKNGPRVCFVTSSDLDGLFLSIEDGLVGDTLDWRVDRPKDGPRR